MCMSSRSTPAPRAPCRSCPRPPAYTLADIATRAMLGSSLTEQGITDMLSRLSKQRWYVKAPAFSFAKLTRHGCLSLPGDEVHRRGHRLRQQAQPRAVQGAAGLGREAEGLRHRVRHHLADEDKEEALPLVRRFYRLGFNIEATIGHRAVSCSEHGIRTRVRGESSDEGSDEILDSHPSRATSATSSTPRDVRCAACALNDGSSQIRRCAVENGVTMFTALDTVRVLLDVLEEITLGISTIDA